jgi:branched-subunit amino acid ABC-type transport system permease component
MAGIAQLLWNGIAVGSLLSVAALGLTLIIGILNFLNIAYGEYLAIGAYISFTANTVLGLPVYVSVLFGTVAIGIGAVLIDLATFKHFRSRPSLTLLLVSIGLAFILRNLIRLIWGVGPKRFDTTIAEAPLVFGIRVLPEQVVAVVVGLTALLAVYLVLQRTLVGIAMRAASDNLDLARVRGVDTERLVYYLWIIAGLVAGLAGSLIGVQTQLTPTMGFGLLLPLFAAVVLGGVGKPIGAVAGGYTIGVLQELSVAVIPSTYKPGVGMAVLVLVLLFKPEGLLGGHISD